jgi:hypothetical protein
MMTLKEFKDYTVFPTAGVLNTEAPRMIAHTGTLIRLIQKIHNRFLHNRSFAIGLVRNP